MLKLSKIEDAGVELYEFGDGSFIRVGYDFVENSLNRISLSQLPCFSPTRLDRAVSDSPLMERLYQIALCDVEDNIVKAGSACYFGAGSEFGPKVFTRDIAYSGVLGLNKLCPELMRASLCHTRQVRRHVGFQISASEYEDDASIPWVSLDLGPDEFVARFLTNSYKNRTDDVCWLWAMVNLYETYPELSDWTELLEQGNYFFETFYDRFFDPRDGLFRGQASFVDIGYPAPKGTGYEEDLSVYQRIQIKALSTNCLYLWGLSAMSKAAFAVGDQHSVRIWSRRHDELREAVRQAFLKSDGSLAYYKRPDGRMDERSDALGTAFAVLSRVVKGEEAAAAVRGYPISDAGVPLFNPFYEDPRWYHNHSSWPFVDAFFLKAYAVATGEDCSGLVKALLALTCVNDGRFHEVRDFRTKEVKGSSKQLWTAAAFLGLFE